MLQVIKTVLLLYIQVFFLQSCNNGKNRTAEKVTKQLQNESNVLTPFNKEDTLVIGDVHIVINDTSRFLNKFKKNPGKFYYSDIGRRDFFLLHDQSSQTYYLLGAENGGCLSCISYMEFINKDALTKKILPEEIQDTIRFEPHRINALKYKILEYPYLQLGNKEKLFKETFAKKGFKLIKNSNGRLLTNADGGKLYQKITDYTILCVIIKNNEIARISILENVDVF